MVNQTRTERDSMGLASRNLRKQVPLAVWVLLIEKAAQKFERIPGVRIERDTDGQPIFESLVSGFYMWKMRMLEQL